MWFRRMVTPRSVAAGRWPLASSLAPRRQLSPRTPLRHLAFCTAFVSASFAGAVVYKAHNERNERLRLLQQRFHSASSIWSRRAPSPASESPRLTQIDQAPLLQRVQRQLANASDASKTLLAITAANVMVFAAWHTPLPPLRLFLTKYFVSTPQSPRLIHHFLSSFSHMSGAHLALNMVGLWSFGRAVHDELGREQFLFFYSSAAVLSSLSSYLYSRQLRCTAPSLGASGAVLAVLAAFTYEHPEHRLMLVLLPFFSMPAWAALASLTAFDVAGVLFGVRLFDHAAHLGGILFGYSYAAHLRQFTWDQRKPLLHAFESLLRRPPPPPSNK